MNGFGVSEFTTSPWSFEQDVAASADLGIQAIEVTEFKLDPQRLAQQFELLKESGLIVSSVQAKIHSIFPDSLYAEPPEPADRVRHIRTSIEAIAPHVPAGTPFVVISGKAPRGNFHEAYEKTRSSLTELARVAESSNVTLAFEPLNPILLNTDSAIWSLGDALELIQAVNHPAVKLCVDFWNIWQDSQLEHVIQAAAGQIGIVQVSDWRRPRAHSDRVSLGDGDIPLRNIVTALEEADYAGPYVLEIFSSESLPDSIWRSDLKTVLLRNKEKFEELRASIIQRKRKAAVSSGQA